MENITQDFLSASVDENKNTKVTESTENFQKFMVELFEKNGVINDLRAYLRGHIVSVLKSAETGEVPSCQKHFTQRLELPSQALNILIAEYLLRMEFSYSLSVFVSEIPLANMVFGFAKELMENISDHTQLRFKDNDVWSILNYLGIKCDSEHASKILEIYNENDSTPLVLCILKSMPLYKKQSNVVVNETSSQESISSNKGKDSDIAMKPIQDSPSEDKCDHPVYCRTCIDKLSKIKGKYKKKKKKFIKHKRVTKKSSLKMELFMKNINSMDVVLVDELFEQLKEVYEAELKMMKQDEEKLVKRTLENQANIMQKKCEELESTLKQREASLQLELSRKKKFLWGVARALRRQHRHMTSAMRDVRAQTHRLADEEEKLKVQLAEAEKTLRDRGEEMRSQISSEILILEHHLETMKKERDLLNTERTELESLKQLTQSSKCCTACAEKEDLKSNYDLLANELSLLKKYVEIDKGKTSMHTVATLTETEIEARTSNVVLNNEQDIEKNEANMATPNRVVNEFGKPKNINFDQWSATSGRAEPRAELSVLEEENRRLRDFARQQRAHIESLEYQQSRLQAQLAARPVTAPQPPRFTFDASRTGVHSTCLGRAGGGEELSMFSGAAPRLVLPGDHIPFVGLLDNRRSMCTWRGGRRRASPLGGITKAARPTTGQSVFYNINFSKSRPESGCPNVEPSCSRNDTSPPKCNNSERRAKSPESTSNKSAIKSPFVKTPPKAKKSQSSKENLKIETPIKREKSPNTILREAKIRLRKLEIEAEAVEQSYLKIKRSREASKDKKNEEVFGKENRTNENVSDQNNPPTTKLTKTQTKETYQSNQQTVIDTDKYLKLHQAKLDLTATHFKNKITTSNLVKPIPSPYNSCKPLKKENFLETPLPQFRKLYHSEKREIIDNFDTIDQPKQIPKNVDVIEKPKQAQNVDAKNNDNLSNQNILKIELNSDNMFKIEKNTEVFKEVQPSNENLDTTKDLKEASDTIHFVTDTASNVSEDKSQANSKIEEQISPIRVNDAENNLLKVNIENNVKDITIKESPTLDLLLVVESSIENSNVSDTEIKGQALSPKMTIIVSPKRSTGLDNTAGKSFNLEPEKLTEADILEPIFKYDEKLSMHYEVSKDGLENMEDFENLETNEDPDYADDFSAENLNSQSDYDTLTPISLPKTSEDENFWDS